MLEEIDDLTIPAFLARPRTGRRFVLPAERAPRSHYTKPQRPEGERWTRADRFRVHLHDQAPRIGSGIRSLWVIVGRKRVGLSDGHIKTVIPRADWNQIARKAVKLEV